MEKDKIAKVTPKANVIVFGIGQIFYLLKTYIYSNYNVIAFTDNDAKKQGTLLDDIEIINPKDISEYCFDKIIVTTTGFQKCVVKQLIESGIDKDNIILGINWLLMNDEGNSYEYYIDEHLDISFKCTQSKCSIVTIEKKDFTWITSPKDSVITPSLISSGLFSQPELDTFFLLANEYFGQRKGVFLDIGANIGTTSLAATKNCGVSEVIAIEPSSDNFALLQCNIFINKLHNKIRGINAVASDTNGFANLQISPDLPSDHRVRNSTCFSESNNENIISITIDSLVKDRFNEIAFMWIDVQGYEYHVLNGANNLISNSKVAIQIEFWPVGLKETNTLDLLCEYCKKNFSKYVDVKEYINGVKLTHAIDKIDSLSDKYEHTHTDLFLIP